MNPLIGGEKPSADAILQMQTSPYNFPDTRWAAYQNHDLGHPELGHLQFLATGPGNTFKQPPDRFPDTARRIGWRYVHVGFVNLETGKIDAAG
jgi:hypothetical protein